MNHHKNPWPFVVPVAGAALFAAFATSAQSRLDQLRGGGSSTPSFNSDAGAADARLQAANVGSGSSPTESRGPSGELRGTTDDHPEAITGPITEADAARVVRSKMSQLQPCYDRARTADRRLGAVRVNLRLTIERDGRLRPPQVNAVPANPAIVTCLTTALSAMTFPRPATAPLVLQYPLQFAPPATPPRRPAGRR
ncbi:MAG: AgmX/PglI C-terminal domain-containing protein [Myxococcales bacterium]|nr:AgmX/PglI C-terminal domain-containing protein [Myxococcales bacterium]